MNSRKAGNAVVMILVAVFLFGLLAATFMRSAKTGQGNMNTQQARLYAQEILDFMNSVERAANNLRSKNCSEADISFENGNDAGAFVAYNHPATAPADKSCHVFDVAGAGLNMNMEWERYQLSRAEIPTTPEDNYGQAYFRIGTTNIVGIGTSALDLMFQLNYVDPQICDAYNKILRYDIDLTIEDNGPATGDAYAVLANKYTYCYLRSAASNLYQIRYVWAER